MHYVRAGQSLSRVGESTSSVGRLLGLQKLCEHGPFDEAIGSFHLHRLPVSPSICYSLIQWCINRKDLKACREVNDLIKRSGLGSNVFLGNHLIRMFALCGSLLEANQVFCSLPTPNAFTWSTIISANAKLGHSRRAVELYSVMQESCGKPHAYVFSAVLKACASIGNLQHGKLIHAHAIDIGFELSLSVGNALIDMYAKCGSLEDAYRVLKGLPNRDVVTWGAVIAGCVQHGNGQEALLFFNQLQQECLQPNEVMFASILKACSRMPVSDQGRVIHMHVIEGGFESDSFIGSSLIDMYANYGSLQDAQRVFDRLPKRDVVTWTAMIGASIHHGYGQEAFWLFCQMRQEGMEPNQITFLSIVKTFSSKRSPHEGMLVHSYIIENALDMEVCIGSALVNMYYSCGSLEDAYRVFERLHKRDVVAWDTMIAGYVQHGYGQAALQLFQQMKYEGLKPNEVTFVSILQACSGTATLPSGKLIHAHIIENGFEHDVFVGNALINMYLNCGNLHDAWVVFDGLPGRDVVTWGTMMCGYVQHGHSYESIELFLWMQEQGILPDETLFIYKLKACSSIAALDEGKLTHAHIIENNHELDTSIGNALIDMFGKFRKLDDASRVFDMLATKDVVTWTAMMEGLANNGFVQEAIQMFTQMQQEGVEMNQLTFVSLLKACSSLHEGKWMHTCILESCCAGDIFVGNTLIDMYAKCGSLMDACGAFKNLPMRDAVTWNAIIARCSELNNHELVLYYFKDMQCQGVNPDGATFVSLLSACSHMGLVKEGCQYFTLMQERYGVVPILDHYNCMLDIFGRAGCLEEAEGFIQSTPFLLDNVAWMSLLGHCRSHGKVELGRSCFDQLVAMDCRHGSG